MKSIMNKGLLFVLLVLISVPALFAKSYSEYLAEAKKYEEQKRWCYALGSYYDAMGTDERPENKQEAYERYKKLKDAIVSGNPGLGKYNLFTIHDEWKNLLIDAEKYGSSISIYDITVGELEQGDLDYKTRTATYTAKIDFCLGDRFNKTIHIIEQGYKSAYKKDWTDLPEEWPLYSASSKKDKTYNVDGTLIYARSDWRNKHYINAFYYFEGKQKYGTGNTIWVLYETVGLYDYKFNIVDENGKELVKGKRWLLGDGNQISISGITPEVMDLIDNGKAFINPVGCYLQYGEYNKDDDKGGRTFMKNFPEVQLSMDKVMVICWNNKTDKIYKNFVSTVEYKAINNLEMININDLQIQVLKTEVTQALYVAVMGENPSYFEGEDLPVEQVSWYDAIYFCNKLSELKGFTSVYSVDGNSNTTDWNYTPHNGDSIKGTIEQNEFADGFRLPTEDEWVFAAKGGEQYNFAGSNNPDEVGWYGKLSDIDDVYIGNSGNKTHSVAQKKANAYGLYDMVGNVSEWCGDGCGDGYVICGSNWNTYVDLVGIDYREKPYSRNITDDRKGLRVVRSSPEQIAEKQRLAEELIRQEELKKQEELRHLEEIERQEELKRQEEIARQIVYIQKLIEAVPFSEKINIDGIEDGGNIKNVVVGGISQSFIGYFKVSSYSQYESYHENYDTLIEKYSLNKLQQVFIYLVCNSFSEKEHLPSCYLLREEINNSYSTQLEAFLENFDSIICDTSCGGWHLATEKQTDYCKRQNRAIYNNSSSMVLLIRNSTDEEAYVDAITYIQKEVESVKLEETYRGDKNISVKRMLPIYILEYFKYDNAYYNSAHRYYDVLIEKYSLEKLKQVFIYLVCNRLSKESGFNECYSLDMKESDYSTQAEAFLENFDRIICEPNNGGYHWATENERQYQGYILRNLN